MSVEIAHAEDQVIRVSVPDWPGYFAGSDGFIWSSHKGKMRRLKGSLLKKGKRSTGGGYLKVTLHRGDVEQRTAKVHQLVAEAFVFGRQEGLTVSHIDGDSRNNRPDNLMWETMSDNQQRYCPIDRQLTLF